MELTKEPDLATVTVVFMLTVIVFVLDVLTPSEIAVWTLYLVPLGLTRWSYFKHLTVALSVCAQRSLFLLYPHNPGLIEHIDNRIQSYRVLGILMVRISAFFLKVDGI